MEDEKKRFIKWVKNHKKQLIIVGISISTLIALILCLKNKDTVIRLWDSIQEKIKKANLYSSKWFEAASDAELELEREKIRLAYCVSGDDFTAASGL